MWPCLPFCLSAMSITLSCPHKLQTRSTIAFINQLWELFDQDITIDFTTIDFAEPWPILILAESLRRFVELTRAESCFGDIDVVEASTSRGISYLKHVGFFCYFGFPVGKQIGQALPTINYTPIRIINRADIEGGIFQENIEYICRNISEIFYSENLEAQDMMRYCLREIVRNTFEHATVDSAVIMAQRWKNGNVELAVLDTGRGIYESLKEKYYLPNNRAAMLQAIQPGV